MICKIIKKQATHKSHSTVYIAALGVTLGELTVAGGESRSSQGDSSMCWWVCNNIDNS